MDEKTAWQRFTQTGRLTDYLDYTRYRSAESLVGQSAPPTDEGAQQQDANNDPWRGHSGTDAG